ncbi:MAG: hypothetical protein KAJ95_09270, partial [Gammaproteobacteria bacterium]|nr:hypothetical protein [Gammaproteobacteria bacterium]
VGRNDKYSQTGQRYRFRFILIHFITSLFIFFIATDSYQLTFSDSKLNVNRKINYDDIGKMLNRM